MRRAPIVAYLACAVVLAHAIPASAASIARFATGVTNRAEHITLGSDGNVWFTEQTGGLIGRITPDGVVTEFPTGIPSRGNFSAIISGPDGNIWFVGHGQADSPDTNASIGRMTPMGEVTLFSTDPAAQQITAGPDGNLWFSTAGIQGIGNTPSAAAVGRITPTGAITVFRLPRLDLRGSIATRSIIVGPDGNVWTLVDGYDKQLIRIALDGTATAVGVSPVGHMTLGPDGAFWIASHGIARVTPAGDFKRLTEGDLFAFPFSQATLPIPTSIARGPGSSLWGGAERFLYRLTTDLAVTTYRVLAAKADPNTDGPRGVTTAADGSLWFSWGRAIGRFDPSQPTATISSATAPSRVSVRADGTGSLPRPRVSCPSGPESCSVTVEISGAGIPKPIETKHAIPAGTTARPRFKLTRSTLARLRRSRRQQARLSVFAEHGSGVGADAAHRPIGSVTLVAAGLAPPRPGSCPASSGTVSVISRKGVGCAEGLRIAKRWLARTGYTPGLDGPPRNGLRLSVSGYSCVFRRNRTRDGTTTCTAAAKRIRFLVRIT